MRKRILALSIVTAAVASCSARPARISNDTALHTAPGATPPTSLEDTRAYAATMNGRPGRLALGEIKSVTLEPMLLPVAGERSLLLVAQSADDREAWVRRIDGKTLAQGPLLRFLGERVATAFDEEDGRFTIVTSTGDRLCVTTYASDDATPQGHGCAVSSATSAVPLGDKVAFLELAITRAEGPPHRAPETPKTSTKSRGAGDKSRHVAAPMHHAPKAQVDVKIRWAQLTGEFDDATTSTGIHFEQPLDGMALVDAKPRGTGADLLWFEFAPKRKSSTSLGGARLVAGTLRADGSLDTASRVAVVDGDLEFGFLKDHHAPRLFTGDDATVFVDLGRDGRCEGGRVLPSKATLAMFTVTCSIAPSRLAATQPIDTAEIAAYEKILAEAPRRVFGQTPHDPGLVAWAGDRAYFLSGDKLRSASRQDGVSRDEPPPFPAMRSRIAWGAFGVDGEGVALVDDSIVHVDALGQTVNVSLPAGAARGILQAVDPIDRRRVARVGATYWLAREDLVRVFPDVAAPPSLRGVAHADGSALVGGEDRGLLIEVAGGALHVSTLDPAGRLSTLAIGAATGPLAPRISAPVRPGFDACERAGGGALVAGVSAADPAAVVAFAMDRDGRLGATRSTPLKVRPGELLVRMTPLPNGGALLTDLERRMVVWLDDDARPLESAAWPLDEGDAICIDGRPARSLAPTAVPGKLERLAEFAAKGTCIVGDPVASKEGALRWFGSTVHGLDATAEVGRATIDVVDTTPPGEPAASVGKESPSVAPLATASASLAAEPACPSDMVAIEGDRFCIDRFEAMLVDAATGEVLSPDYSVAPSLLEIALGEWSTGRERTGDLHARAFPLPLLSAWQRTGKPVPVAVARYGVRPSGYVSGVVAEAACQNAGKRLCALDEFTTACRGEANTDFPYGKDWEDGACNVFRDEHPAGVLHGNLSVGHLDPRLNHVLSKGRPLFQRTGQSLACRSKWGSDAVYDLVGNVDEWVDRGPKLGAAFAGGFYSRSTRSGCDAIVSTHPKPYFDYSTGVRCCKDALGPAKSAAASASGRP